MKAPGSHSSGIAFQVLKGRGIMGAWASKWGPALWVHERRAQTQRG